MEKRHDNSLEMAGQMCAVKDRACPPAGELLSEKWHLGHGVKRGAMLAASFQVNENMINSCN